MKRSFLSKVVVFSAIIVMFMLVGCKNNFAVESYEESFDNSDVEVIIGEELIYGESFSFNQLYASNFSANEILNLIDKYNVITFQELYDALIKDYPSKKSVIQNVFKTYYVSYGNEINY